ncbi:transglutaminase-like cysteine peptidase [Bradyrhizobium sp.]|uniref:transglutaminase-like cysteine peptidase n=1 Tax=Bradyrhizobium sp. TaxID=376 RepID=UPI000AC8DAC6|nr:transglutaminase-like cysteine peptidase [Bradyrhizobium sp.]
MTPRQRLRKLGLSGLITALVFSVSAHAGSSRVMAADEPDDDVAVEFMPGSDRNRGPARPPATFFSINAVLAKLDRQRGRGPDAVRFASLTPSNVATDAAPAAKQAPPVGKEPFGLFTFRAPDGMLWRKWRGIEADMAREQVILDRCRADSEHCPPHAAQFLRLINAVSARSGRARLEEANRAVNMAIRYVSDHALHGEADRWSAPLASIAVTKGDCEDYAIAKYVALREAGVARENLQLVLVRDRSVRQDHAVLAARLDDRWLILDNRQSLLIEDADASSFIPLFAINHDGVHLFAAPYARRALPDDQTAAAPAAAGEAASFEWTGSEAADQGASDFGRLPLLM